MRFELFSKTVAEALLAVQAISLNPSSAYYAGAAISTPPILAVNLPHKVKNEFPFSIANKIIEIVPEADICMHYSMKYNSARTLEEAVEKFGSFLTKAESIGIRSVLLVSGGGEKKSVNSLTLLQEMQRKGATAGKVQIGVAYNPFFPNDGDRVRELQRLKDKISTSMVTSIWLQFGSDTVLLSQGLENLKRLELDEQKVKIFGSLFVPSKLLLARMRFRPWNGVFLSDAYLNDIEEANRITRMIVDLYHRQNVEILIETGLKSDKDFDNLNSVLSTTAVTATKGLVEQAKKVEHMEMVQKKRMRLS